MAPGGSGIVPRYLELGLSLGRHVDGLVDAYYGPAELAERASSGPARPPSSLAEEARDVLEALDSGEPLGTGEEGDARRGWLGAQVRGLLTTARSLAGERIPYADEVEQCYGVRPRRVEEDAIREAHRRLEEAVPGAGPLQERYAAWREAHAVPTDRLEAAISSLAEDLRGRTAEMLGLPPGEKVTFELVTSKPWSGFNYYEGNLHSRIAVNVDLPVLSTTLAHLVAHEAYPGHHTEHSRKEAGLVRKRQLWEESLFVVGTPQCLISEGLADLALEVAMGPRPEATIAEHLLPLGIFYDADVVAAVSEVGETLNAVRGEAAFRLHEDGAEPRQVVEEVSRWALLPEARAEKAVEFLMDPTWRAYVTCYVEGLPLCRSFVNGSLERFSMLVTEQVTPADLRAA